VGVFPKANVETNALIKTPFRKGVGSSPQGSFFPPRPPCVCPGMSINIEKAPLTQLLP
jgi:hypothetical protein